MARGAPVAGICLGIIKRISEAIGECVHLDDFEITALEPGCPEVVPRTTIGLQLNSFSDESAWDEASANAMPEQIPDRHHPVRNAGPGSPGGSPSVLREDAEDDEEPSKETTVRSPAARRTLRAKARPRTTCPRASCPASSEGRGSARRRAASEASVVEDFCF
mmetsp:Transcript_29122/g.73805  ORF Transcript_29122/g.73805 Transcript_29122/m.73805 type:complete len:163 (-) Transcript_29122:92-580(-)|eukprot:CAMPEP_0183414306 /NCGR_PEP_ID=MMETSP0370-20130417/22305_1 /TAXON_ID=268820 /ORGANISM="Peridinium aciculiferum, Strain PAER-2" /LENGTH=162 /DNA_ID=CAMNT_0025597621 /DNA_START=85 /DNA_END=573 /DNA_ORIENTATION=-